MRALGLRAGEDGLTLVEMLVTMTLMLIVLGATLTTFNVFERNARRNQDQNQAQEQARAGVDRIAKDLRNHSTPTNELPVAIEKASSDDLALITVGPAKPAGSLNARNLERVRYCLGSDSRTVWRQRQTYASTPQPGPPATTSCPSADWEESTAVAEGVVNNGGRAVFCFPPAPCGSDIADTRAIRRISIALFVDVSPDAPPRETRLSTTVALRNQNRAPTASFEATAIGAGHVLLVASASQDPEGQALFYRWSDGGTPISTCGGMVCNYRAPATGARTFTLEVSDPSDLKAPPVSKTVLVR